MRDSLNSLIKTSYTPATLPYLTLPYLTLPYLTLPYLTYITLIVVHLINTFSCPNVFTSIVLYLLQ